MTNEFIVWDEEEERFIDETKCIFKDGTLFRNEKAFANEISDDLTMFWSVGKTDINNKKIYTDCSIVEFKEPYHGSELKGSFVWCNETLRYKISIIQGTGRFQEGTVQEIMKESRWSGLVPKFVDYNIIDTIQENKLGLIK